MKLLKLTLDNFRAAKHLEFIPEGRNAAIYGRNSTGKTTVYNAYTWLLFGKSATGEKRIFLRKRWTVLVRKSTIWTMGWKASFCWMMAAS